MWDLRVLMVWFSVLLSANGQYQVYDWIISNDAVQQLPQNYENQPVVAYFPYGDVENIDESLVDDNNQPYAHELALLLKTFNPVTIGPSEEEIGFKANSLQTTQHDVGTKLQAAKYLFDAFGSKNQNIPNILKSTTTSTQHPVTAIFASNPNSVPELPYELRSFLAKLKDESQRRREATSFVPDKQKAKRLEHLFDAINNNIKTDKLTQRAEPIGSEMRSDDISLEDLSEEDEEENNQETNSLKKLSDKEIGELITFFDKFMEIYHKLAVVTSTQDPGTKYSTTDRALAYVKDSLKLSSTKYGAIDIIISKHNSELEKQITETNFEDPSNSPKNQTSTTMYATANHIEPIQYSTTTISQIQVPAKNNMKQTSTDIDGETSQKPKKLGLHVNIDVPKSHQRIVVQTTEKNTAGHVSASTTKQLTNFEEYEVTTVNYLEPFINEVIDATTTQAATEQREYTAYSFFNYEVQTGTNVTEGLTFVPSYDVSATTAPTKMYNLRRDPTTRDITELTMKPNSETEIKSEQLSQYITTGSNFVTEVTDIGGMNEHRNLNNGPDFNESTSDISNPSTEQADISTVSDVLTTYESTDGLNNDIYTPNEHVTTFNQVNEETSSMSILKTTNGIPIVTPEIEGSTTTTAELAINEVSSGVIEYSTTTTVENGIVEDFTKATFESYTNTVSSEGFEDSTVTTVESITNEANLRDFEENNTTQRSIDMEIPTEASTHQFEGKSGVGIKNADEIGSLEKSNNVDSIPYSENTTQADFSVPLNTTKSSSGDYKNNPGLDNVFGENSEADMVISTIYRLRDMADSAVYEAS